MEYNSTQIIMLTTERLFCVWDNLPMGKDLLQRITGKVSWSSYLDHHLTYCFFSLLASSLGIGLAINLVCLLLSLLPNFILGFPSGEKHNIFICCVHRILHECSCRSHDNYEHVSVGQQQVPGLLLISLHDSANFLISLVPAVSTQVGYNYHIWLGSDNWLPCPSSNYWAKYHAANIRKEWLLSKGLLDIKVIC